MCDVPTKVDTSIKAGDKVRSYDFPDDWREDAKGCYIEGIVVQVGEFPELGLEAPRYKVRVSRRCWLGKFEPVDAEFPRVVYPPVNGTPKLLGGVCNGVEKIDCFTDAAVHG